MKEQDLRLELVNFLEIEDATKSQPEKKVKILHNFWKKIDNEIFVDYIEKLIPKILPNLNDCEALMLLMVMSPKSFIKDIKKKISEVYQNTGDIKIFLHYWKITEDSKYFTSNENMNFFQESIQKRIKVLCDDSSDFNKLASMQDLFSHYEIRKTIKKRLEKLIEEVSTNNIPDWFIELMQKKDELTEEIQKKTYKKAAELYLEVCD